MYEDIFQVKSNNITPSQGRIIIASPLLNDYHFSRTVILTTKMEIWEWYLTRISAITFH